MKNSLLLVTKQLGKDEGVDTKALSYQLLILTVASWLDNNFRKFHEYITKYSF